MNIFSEENEDQIEKNQMEFHHGGLQKSAKRGLEIELGRQQTRRLSRQISDNFLHKQESEDHIEIFEKEEVEEITKKMERRIKIFE